MTNKDNKQDTNEIDTYKTYNRELIRGDGPHDNKTAEVETKSLKTTTHPPPPNNKKTTNTPPPNSHQETEPTAITN